MAKLKHTHKFRRGVYSTGTKFYFCILDCDYKIDTKLALGKKTICHRCGAEFIMNTYTITLDKPHCEKCHIHKSDRRKHNGRVAEDKDTKLSHELVAVSEAEQKSQAKTAGDSVAESLSERLKQALNVNNKDEVVIEDGDLL